MTSRESFRQRGRAGSAGRSWLEAVGSIVLIAAVGAAALVAFAGPGLSGGPRDVPLAVVGPEVAVEQVDHQLADVLGEEAVAVDRVEDAQAARTAVEEQEYRGALILGRDGNRMLVASGAGPVVAQMFERVAGELPEQAGGPAVVEDLAPLPDGDARGVIPGAMLLPTAMAGIGAGMLAALRLGGRGRGAAVVLGAAAVAGATYAGILQAGFDALPGPGWGAAAVLGLGMAAIGLSVAGAHRLVGLPGAVLMIALTMLLGTPLSGAQAAPEMLPGGWAELGQALPSGAMVTALRAVAFFDGVGAGGALAVLGGWAAAGLLAMLLPAGRRIRDRARGSAGFAPSTRDDARV